MALSGISTVGGRLLYAVETTAGVAPEAEDYKYFTRINNVAGIPLESETIDSSALEDEIEQSIDGRQSLGGTWSVTVNLTDDTIKEWEDCITASRTAKASNKSTYFQVYLPNLAKSFFVKATPPKTIPMPELAQNELATVELTLTINEYVGQSAKLLPSS